MRSIDSPLPVSAFLVLCCGVDRMVAQPAAGAAFDVASVKQNRSGDVRTGGQLVGNRFSQVNETLWRLIAEAYADPRALPRFRIVGGPSWLDVDRFDVHGVAEHVLTRPQAQLMLRALLADRFKLAVHRDTRELPVFTLSLARDDKRLGPDLRRSNTNCAASPPVSDPQALPASTQPVPCVIQFGFGRLAAVGMTLGDLATIGLSRYVNRAVTDHTGLAGPFDWRLAWTPDNLPRRGPGTPDDKPVLVNGISVDPDGPPLATALQEQLGLRLQPGKGLVDVLVIDHVQHPTDN
jgi:uncharacterized protein (TIGR03435 family)